MRPSILNELDILHALDHPNIANFNECYEDDDYIHAILELSPGESLAEMFMEQEKRLPILDILKIFYQICKTAAYLRKKEIIHRDYKPMNIMIYKHDGKYKLLGYQIQLLDFGFARKFEASLNDKEILGSPYYVAPESLGQKYSYSVDVWSIGVMLYFAISHRFPFNGENEEDLFKAIKEDKLQFKPKKEWEGVSTNLKSLIEEMLEKDPDKRIDVEQIPVHPAFSEIHQLEDSVHLTSKDKSKLNRYFFKLTPIQRKFLQYSTKFLPPKDKVQHCEKFTLLDKDNFGYLEYNPKDKTSDSVSVSEE